MPTVKQLAVKLVRNGADNLERNLKAMPEDKWSWRPNDAGRSALHQVVECAGFNHLGAQVLKTHEFPPFDPQALKQAEATYDTLDKALGFLHTSTDEFVAAIEALPEADLDAMVTLPWGQRSLAEVIFLVHNNMVYHLGQINHIQMQYGDYEMH
ncbi:MAG TPA: DinB family protein [Chthonomonadaceae bacterium]|nr:DinB family protein [Chthonomonadaceae bacterium]